MLPHSLDLAARSVLERYPPSLSKGRLVPLGNRGGFSGARLWQVETCVGLFCLRAWPPRGPAPKELASIHRLMIQARNAGLAFVPVALAARSGASFIESDGRLWDLTDWLPGRADFDERPSPARLAAAFTALARLHRVWAEAATERGPCPAVRRRLRSHAEWLHLIRDGWRPAFSTRSADPVHPWAERALTALRRRIGEVPGLLALAAGQTLPLQPCLCDVWHDHVLFDGEAVTGLVDYGSVKLDHVAVDLARLQGSLVGDDEEQRGLGLDAYAMVRPLSMVERELVAVLDRTGTLLGAANWLRWLYHEGRRYEDREAVARRLATLVQRIEKWG